MAAQRLANAWAFRIALAALTLAGAGLRLWMLDTPALWEDDYLNLDRALMPLGDMFAAQKYFGPADTIYDLQPPLYYAVLHFALAVKEGVLAARLPSVAAGTLTVLGVGLLGRRLFGAATGLVAAFWFAVLVFPLAFSQAIKLYAVFLCCTVWAHYCLLKALDKDTPVWWALYCLAAAAMLYSGYQGAAVVLAHACFAGLTLLRRYRDRGRAAGPGAARALAAFALVGVCYLPWAGAVPFLAEMLYRPQIDPLATLTTAFALHVLGRFVSPDPALDTTWTLCWLSACVLGAAVSGARSESRPALTLCGLVAGVCALALLANRAMLQPALEARHFAAVFPVWILLAARGAVWVGQGAGALCARSGPARAAAGLVCAGVALALAWPGLDALPGHYRRVLSEDREFFHWMAVHKNNVDTAEFFGFKANTRRMASRWHNPGMFSPAGDWAGPGYRRAYLCDTYYDDSAPRRDRSGETRLATHKSLFTITDVMLRGLANRAPLVMQPGPDGRYRFEESFADLRFYEECYASTNMVADPDLRMLRPARYSRPGQFTYAFETAPGARPSRARLTVGGALYKHNLSMPSDSALTVEASRDGREFVVLGRLDQADFIGPQATGLIREYPFFEQVGFYEDTCRFAAKAFDLNPDLLGDGTLYVRVRYAPGRVEGFLNLSGLTLEAETDSPGAGRDDGPALRAQARHLLANVRAARWNPEHEQQGAPVAFARPGREALLADLPGISPAALLSAFLAARPAIAPARTLYDFDGRPALDLYDPALAEPFLPLDQAGPERSVRLGDGGGGDLAALTLTGAIDSPVLVLDGKRLELPIIAPTGSVLTLNPVSGGRVFFSPDWITPGGLYSGPTYVRDLKQSTRRRGHVTCDGAPNCALSYAFVSAYPFTELRLKALPSVYKNPCRRCKPNVARILLSTDGGKTSRPILEHLGRDECDWTPDGMYEYLRLRFDKPVTSLFLTFTMEKGEEAAFDAPEWIEGFYIEADLDTALLRFPDVSGEAASVGLARGGAGLGAALHVRPVPLGDRTSPKW